jgi:hypothetical protein
LARESNRGPILVVAACLALAGCGGEKSWNLDGGDLVTVGSGFVDQRGCRMCHGNDLSGSPTAAAGTMVYASNLTPDHATGIGDWADLQIVQAMRYGFDDQLQPLCDPSPKFKDMTDLEAGAIVAYLRSIPPVTRNPPIPESFCPPLKPMPLLDLAPPPVMDMAMPVVDMAMPTADLATDDASSPTDGGAGG